MCPFCGSNWVTFKKARGTHRCNNCGIYNVTPEDRKRWSDPKLPLSEEELALVPRVSNPQVILLQRLLATLERDCLPDELRSLTFAMDHNPNCGHPFQCRLVGPQRGIIDRLPRRESGDIIGGGETLREAALSVLAERERMLSES